MRWTGWAAGILVGALVYGAARELPVATAGGASFRSDTLPVAELRRGMKGYGLTVFEGTRPERFGVEIIDVLKNYLPAQDLILIKTTHPRLDVVRTVRGMSGSPIFIGGKMIGAYSYGWPFGTEPVAGVTPIQDMLDGIDRPLPSDIFGWPLDPLPPSRRRPVPAPRPPSEQSNETSRFMGAPEAYRLDEHAAQLARGGLAASLPTSAPRPLLTPILLGGLGSMAGSMARELFEPLGFEPLQAGGGQAGAEADAPLHFEDGGAIAIQLIRGDINATPLGTVTRVEGDRMVAFGHPMMNAGVTALPTAIGRILWILASEQFSSKFGVAARPLGALINDRQAAIVASESAKAPTIAASLRVEGVPGARKSDWQFEIAHERFLTPSLLAMALGNAIQATAAERQDVSWRAVSKVRVRDIGEISIEDFGVSIGGTPDPRELIRSQLVSAVGGILNNPWKPALLESVQTTLTLTYAREIVRLRGVRVREPEVEAGQPVQLVLTLVPYAGPIFERTISLPLPPNLAGQTLKISVRPGHNVEREQARPESLDDFIRNLESPLYPPKSIVVSYPSGGGVAFGGQVATRLPPGAMDSIAQRSASFSPDAIPSEQRMVVETSQFMVGNDTVHVKVLPRLH